MKKIITLFYTLSLTYVSFTQNVKLVWAKNMGGTLQDVGQALTTDASGNVYTTGYFTGIADFDPGPGIYNLSSGNGNVFITKLNASGNIVWAKNIGGALTDGAQSIAVDDMGNVYTTGGFDGTGDFDPGAATYDLSSAGNYDIFISKLDATGNFVWAKNLGGILYDEGYSVAVDASGNVLTTGLFAGTADFDPGAGTSNLTSAGNADIFISKLNASGNFVWAKNMGAASEDDGSAVAVDALGNVYTTGDFNGTVDFDPGIGTFNLISAGSYDVFVSKLDASGNFIWAKNLGGTFNDFGSSISVDISGNVYTTGNFEGTGDFNPGAGTFNLTSAGMQDIFVSKLNASGNFLWAIKMGGTSADFGSSTVDVSGNVYSTGQFQGTSDFDPGAGTYNLSSAGFKDIFISKINTAGIFVWAIKIGGVAYEVGESVAVDAIGNVYTTGYFEGSVDFDYSAGINNLTSNGDSDVFAVKLSQALWKGNASNSWSDPANWESGVVPGINSNVFVLSGLAVYPTVSLSTEIKSLSIQTGAAVTVQPGVELKIVEQ